MEENSNQIEEPIKLNLGCGNELLPSYINVDLYNKKADKNFDAAEITYPDESVDEIRAYHLIEHFPYSIAKDKVLKEWYRVLKKGGLLHIETPDLLNSCRLFVGCNREIETKLYGHFFAVPEEPGNVHYFLYTEEVLRSLLKFIGFSDIKRMEPDSSYTKENGALPKEVFLNMIGYKK